MRKIITFLFAAALALSPLVTVAQYQTIPCPSGIACPGGITGNATGITGVNAFIYTIINWLLAIAFGLAVLFLIIGGVRYIISGGNEESAEAAKNTIVNALIGIVIIILSYVAVYALTNLLLSNSSNPV